MSDAEIRSQLRHRAETRDLAEGCLTPLRGGLSNESWRLDDDAGDSWFVRGGGSSMAGAGVDRATECAVLKVVSAAGLAPEVRFCDPDSGLLVARFVDGRVLSLESVRSDACLRRIGAGLRRLHGLAVPAGTRPVVYSRQARRLGEGLVDPDGLASSLQGRAGPLLRRIEQRDHAISLCHHDLHRLNILDDSRRLWFVDWEYAGPGDRLLDIAGFLAMHELDRGQTEVFVDACGGLPDVDRGLLDDARWAFDYVQWLWYRRCRALEPDPDGILRDREAGLASRLMHCNNPPIDLRDSTG